MERQIKTQSMSMNSDELDRQDAQAMIDRWGSGSGWQGLYNLHLQGVRNIKRMGYNSILDAGCGVGEVIVAGDNEQIYVKGIDRNKYLKEFFDNNFRHLEHRFCRCDICDYVITEHFDVLYSIEVFEHISDNDLHQFMMQSESSGFKCIYFSSVPPSEQIKIHQQEVAAGIRNMSYEDTEQDWGHINMKEKDGWKEFFARYGFKFLRDEPVVASWGMIFTKE